MAAGLAPHEDRLRLCGALRLSTWRGTSNRQYGVTVFAVAECEPDDLAEAVVIAVRRDATGFSAGLAQIAHVAVCDDAPAAAAFLAGPPKAAVEIHAHRLADGAAARRAVADDLKP